MSSKRSATGPPDSRAAGKRRVGDSEADAVAGGDADEGLEDYLTGDLSGLGGGDLDDFADGDGFDGDLAGALGEGDDDDEIDGLDGALEQGLDRQDSEVPESDTEDPPELPFTEEQLTTSDELDFSEVSLTASQARRAAELIATNSSLTVIHFDGHDLPVGDLKEDEELEWDSEEYQDTEAIIIAELLKKGDCPVTRLDLARNQITDHGAKALAEMLHSNSTLEYLNLESNMVGDKGGKIFSTAVTQNSSLQYLNLMYNSIGSTRQQELRDTWFSQRNSALGLHL